MKIKIKALLGTALSLLAVNADCSTVIIDDFATDFSTTVDTQIDGTSLGGELDVNFYYPTGDASVSSGSLYANYVGDWGTNDHVELSWDGDDSHSDLTFGGLGGVDLTSAGRNDRFLLYVEEFTGTPEFFMRVWGDSIANSLLYGFYLITSPGAIEIPFSAYGAVSGSGTDFSNVGSIVLIVRLGEGDSAKISRFAAIPGPSVVPMLSIEPAPDPGFVRVSWTPGTGTNWVLQSIPNLSDTNWLDVSGVSTNPVDISAPGSNQFFRLAIP